MDQKKLYYQVKNSTDLSNLPKIEGPNFEKEHSIQSFLDSFASIGLQASELSRAIDITRMMIREQASIYLSFTSNMVSSGIREIITFLTKHQKISVLCTAAGGVEEDILKSWEPFRLGTFHVSGDRLFDSGIGRIGNIYATNNHYAYLEKFMQPVFEKALEIQKQEQRGISPSELIHLMGQEIEINDAFDQEKSYLYWAYKHHIPVFCPAIIDGAIGDMLYYYKNSHPEFCLDVSLDHKKIIDYTLQQEKTGAVILGGGISKHYILNANIFKEGFDYTVYISTSQFYDGSDSGGNPEEAISWAKIKVHTPRVKVYCDASIAFPLLVQGAFLGSK